MRTLFSLALVGAVAALGLSATGCKRDANAAPKATTAGANKVKVSTVDVTEGTMPRVLPLTGTLKGEKQSDLAAGTAGRLTKVNVERGSDVKAGDVLALVDVRQAAISAQEATASAALAREQVTSAKRDCERYKGLFEKGSISRAEYDRYTDTCTNTELTARAADLRAQQAGITVADGVIRAPFSGTVAEKFIDVGEYVRADSKVVSLVTLNPLRLEFAVPESRISLVKKDAKVTFTVPAQPKREFSGTVRYLGQAVKESTRDLTIEAVVDNADRALAPGMFAEIQLVLGEERVPTVPTSALVPREGSVHVFIVEDGRAAERVITQGATKGDLVAITRGVKTGEKIIVSPPAALVNGAYLEL